MRRHKARLLTGIIVAALLIAGSLPASGAGEAAKVGDWFFFGNLDNQIVGSPLKMSHLVAGGPNSFPQYEVDNLGIETVLQHPLGSGVHLRGIPKPNRSVYSIDVYFCYDNAIGSYARILSFGPVESDRGLYIHNNTLELYPANDGAIPVFTEDEFFHVLVTRNAKGIMRGYFDGALQWSYKDRRERYLLKNGVVDFFVDDGSENMVGAVSRIQVYDRAITPA